MRCSKRVMASGHNSPMQGDRGRGPGLLPCGRERCFQPFSEKPKSAFGPAHWLAPSGFKQRRAFSGLRCTWESPRCGSFQPILIGLWPTQRRTLVAGISPSGATGVHGTAGQGALESSRHRRCLGASALHDFLENFPARPANGCLSGWARLVLEAEPVERILSPGAGRFPIFRRPSRPGDNCLRHPARIGALARVRYWRFTVFGYPA